MIKSVLSNTGAYADLWSYLKSVDHALSRALHSSATSPLQELDKDRLLALRRFLLNNFVSPKEEDLSAFLTLSAKRNEPVYTPDFDVRDELKNIREFAGPSIEKRIQKLADFIEKYVNDSPKSLYERTPVEELQTLRLFIGVLLRHLQSALQV